MLVIVFSDTVMTVLTFTVIVIATVSTVKSPCLDHCQATGDAATAETALGSSDPQHSECKLCSNANSAVFSTMGVCAVELCAQVVI